MRLLRCSGFMVSVAIEMLRVEGQLGLLRCSWLRVSEVIEILRVYGLLGLGDVQC